MKINLKTLLIGVVITLSMMAHSMRANAQQSLSLLHHAVPAPHLSLEPGR